MHIASQWAKVSVLKIWHWNHFAVSHIVVVSSPFLKRHACVTVCYLLTFKCGKHFKICWCVMPIYGVTAVTKSRVLGPGCARPISIFPCFLALKFWQNLGCSSLWKQPDDLHYVNQKPAWRSNSYDFFSLWDFCWIFKFRLNKTQLRFWCWRCTISRLFFA